MLNFNYITAIPGHFAVLMPISLDSYLCLHAKLLAVRCCYFCSYGTGAIMAVPGHDTRDHEFASKYDIPIHWVVKPGDQDGNTLGKVYPGDGVIMNSSSTTSGLDINGLSSKEAISKVIQWAEETGNGKKKVWYLFLKLIALLLM